MIELSNVGVKLDSLLSHPVIQSITKDCIEDSISKGYTYLIMLPSILLILIILAVLRGRQVDDIEDVSFILLCVGVFITVILSAVFIPEAITMINHPQAWYIQQLISTQ